MNFNIVLSLMSGTSIDSVDGLLVKIYGNDKYELIENYSIAYSNELRAKILAAANNEACTKDVSMLNFAIGKIFAECANKLIKKSGMNKSEIDFISSHGQTIYHQPNEDIYVGIPLTSTLQIGDISVISALTGITTVGDFRTKDMALGGQGAPLVPFADEIIFGRKIPRIIQNIGGIANSTVLSGKCNTFAFDNGPGNMMIDYAMKKYFDLPYDKNGEVAKSGKVHEKWLQNLLSLPYYSAQPPKTTGRELFNKNYIEQMLYSAPLDKCDIISTLTFLTSKVIYNSYKDFIYPKTNIEEMVLCGGGAYNEFLVESLKSLFGNISIKKHEDFGIDSKFKECLAFAYLGKRTMLRQINNLPSCTGAKEATVMGKIAY